MTRLTDDELYRIEEIESDAKDAHKTAKLEADEARKQFAQQKLDDLGIVICETICTAPQWGWYDDKLKRVVVQSLTDEGKAFCRLVTTSGKVHSSANGFATDIEKLKIEGTA